MFAGVIVDLLGGKEKVGSRSVRRRRVPGEMESGSVSGLPRGCATQRSVPRD
jgi:hypothetical protein